MPEGDTIHRLALRFQPLVGETIEVLALPRKNVRDDAYLGRTIASVEARGKNLLVHLEGGVTLRTHLKMHGRWTLSERAGPKPFLPQDTVVFVRTGRFDALCRSAPIAELVRTSDLGRRIDAQVRSGLGDLGIDILAPGFDPEEAARRWHAAGHPTIAQTLLDQRLVAGIGNEWKSELLFIVKVHPLVPAASVPHAILAALAREAETRMRFNVKRTARLYPIDRARAAGRIARLERKPSEGPLSVYGRGGEPCYDCGARIERRMDGDPPRSTYFCPGCQPLALTEAR